ncbi:MAG: 1,4-alpha-glucan branching protein GlgB [Eubacteriales bacterium]|jgi:1,4-alpha-glucan branching enzyme
MEETKYAVTPADQPVLPKDDIYLFNTGKAQKAYLAFGCHRLPGTDEYRFMVWAPNAQSVSLVGDFNDWDGTRNPMQKTQGGVYFTVVKGLEQGSLYKYLVTGYDGVQRYKSDPFAFYAEMRPNNASRVWELEGYDWQDGSYMDARAKKKAGTGPISIYEMHAGSWMDPDNKDQEFINFRELADKLVPYIKKMGFTHVELMPITEYPFDMSWGYQVAGYYGVTSRYGTPQDFMYFVDRLHEAGIGLILDWVPAHFPRDVHGLAMFDGTHLYDHSDPRQGEQPDWGTYLFNYGRPEVESFLISSAMFFADVYHVDGIRIDAVSAMLYLDFGKQDNFVPNKDGGNINLEAVEFLRRLNSTLAENHPGFLSIAEESTAFPYITKPVEEGGLGFTMKWNMGFMHDTLHYMEMDPFFRQYNHHDLTFSMEYAFSENYVLAFSHDEVVHGKRSMISKMYGTYEEQFASLRAMYGYTFAHPGKKLLFMGAEFAQFIEWDYKKQLDWFLPRDYEMHRKMSDYVARLNRLYRKYRALYEVDDSWEGFQWLNVEDRECSVIAFQRKAKPRAGKTQSLVCVMNFTPVGRENYWINLPGPGTLKLVLSSEEKKYGGMGRVNELTIKAQKRVLEKGRGRRPARVAWYAPMQLPPLSALYFEWEEEQPASKRRKTSTKQAADQQKAISADAGKAPAGNKKAKASKQ